MSRNEQFAFLEHYAEKGKSALASATPKDTGETANSWTYEIKRARGFYQIKWNNTHIVNGVPIAIIIQYGHGTGTGGWVEGRDYINPAIQPIFDQILDDVWEKVRNA